MKILYTNHFKRRLKKRVKNNPVLKQKIAKQVGLFQQNQLHPSLKLHKLRGERIDQFSLWIEGNLRITFIPANGDIVFTDILTHDEY